MEQQQPRGYLVGNFLICFNGFLDKWENYLIRESQDYLPNLQPLLYLLSRLKLVAEVDVLITVGSQVALFEEMKLFHVSDDTLTARSEVNFVPKPTNVHRWINVFDFNDFLGFATESVFQGVKDFEYRTGNVLLASHNTYFNLPTFHERLAERIRDKDS